MRLRFWFMSGLSVCPYFFAFILLSGIEHIEFEEAQMTTVDNSNREIPKKMSVLRRSFLGPLSFGIIFGGIPFGVLLGILGLGALSSKLVLWLAPVAVILGALGANLSVNRGWFSILWRAFLTSFSVCVPVPILVWTLLAWRAGYEVFDTRNFPMVLMIFVMFAVVITVPSWVLALVFENFRT
jgi:hypothetical protein